MTGGLLVVGASQAGVQLVVSLRALGHTGPVTLLGDEDHRPYQRPALSKDFLAGTVGKESLIFRTAEFWAEHDIAVVQGRRITAVTTNPDGSGTATAADGSAFDFDRLALTVGARARALPVPGADLDGVVHLRNADDALSLKARLPHVRSAVVVGGGFIGLEVAASLRAMGVDVVVCEAGQRLVGRAVGEQTSAWLLDHHRGLGTDVRLGATVTEVLGEQGRVTGVCVDGAIVTADLVLVGIGVIPNTELAEQLGVTVDDGIVVDRWGRTSDGHTLALGDCSNQPNPMPGAVGERVRLESVNNAVEQAKVAAYALTGRTEEYPGTPWFWSNQGSLKLQIAGLSRGADQSVVRDGGTKRSLLHYRGGRLVAADCLNAPMDFMAVKAALGRGLTVPPDAAADPAQPLKSLTVDAHPEY